MKTRRALLCLLTAVALLLMPLTLTGCGDDPLAGTVWVYSVPNEPKKGLVFTTDGRVAAWELLLPIDGEPAHLQMETAAPVTYTLSDTSVTFSCTLPPDYTEDSTMRFFRKLKRGTLTLEYIAGDATMGIPASTGTFTRVRSMAKHVARLNCPDPIGLEEFELYRRGKEPAPDPFG